MNCIRAVHKTLAFFFKSELVLQCPIRFDTVDLAGKFIGPAFIETLNILNNCIAKM